MTDYGAWSAYACWGAAMALTALFVVILLKWQR